VSLRTFNLALLGFGNVNRSLVELLRMKEGELRTRHRIEWKITGVASRRLDWWSNPAGFDSSQLGKVQSPQDLETLKGQKQPTLEAWLEASRADVLFEATSLDVENGEPAITHIRTALEHGAHAITANKGPIVHAYRELRDLAARRGKRFLFESTVMDGIPIFSLFRDTLPAIEVKGFRGILNSTTNVILTGMEEGLSFEDSLKRAQQIGVAETDATYDIEGWDATVKVAALVNVVMEVALDPKNVSREGIRKLTPEAVRSAKAAGKPYKLVCKAQRTADGVTASVRPEQLPLVDPMALVSGASSIVRFETDIFPGLTITEESPGLYATAYGMLADLVRAVGD
jgi:homoserine dehydrogenase